MKKTYISPLSEVVKLKLSSSIMEGAGVMTGSKGADAGDMQAKRLDAWSFDEEKNSEKQHNVWE